MGVSVTVQNVIVYQKLTPFLVLPPCPRRGMFPEMYRECIAMAEVATLFSRHEVQRRCGLGRSSIYKLMGAGEFPAPLRVGIRGVRWRERAVRDWVEKRPRATGDGHGGRRTHGGLDD